MRWKHITVKLEKKEERKDEGAYGMQAEWGGLDKKDQLSPKSVLRYVWILNFSLYKGRTFKKVLKRKKKNFTQVNLKTVEFR